MAASKESIRSLKPLVKNIAEITGKESSPLLIHFTSKQWEQATSGAIDGWAARLRRPARGLLIFTTPALPHGKAIPNPNPFPHPSPIPPLPDLPPKHPDWILGAQCKCLREGWCGHSVENIGNPHEFTITCKCHCPPTFEIEPPPVCRPRFSSVGGIVRWDCVGECVPHKHCQKVYWPIRFRLFNVLGMLQWSCTCVVPRLVRPYTRRGAVI